ncbi:hypothetical protein GGR51DRAFT_511399 [Nemania sp. FL0031]|nr:hypothetical protein GGR51DRAFT_511399 [Nemania sp. FL0031]
MASGSNCPEGANSTDCLLRALLQSTNGHFGEYNWDPIAFGFTVPVGIIAALFAAFTIYQAVTTTSRGSRKCNWRAIGDWSCQTTKRWDWHDLCRISTAQTPILTTANIQRALKLESILYRSDQDEESNQDDEPNQNAEPNQNITFIQKISAFWKDIYRALRGPPRQKSQGDNPSAASWLGFLDELNLVYSDMRVVPLKVKIADYLPDDLLAVPAYGEVGFIVAAAAAAGAYSWKVDERSGYPTILGRSFQFEFRSHQTLGTIGSFIKYDYRLESRRAPTVKQLESAFLQSLGGLKVDWFPSEVFKGEQDNNHRLFDVLHDSASNLIFSLSRHFYARNHTCQTRLCMCWRLSYYRKDSYHLMWLLVANAPPRPPVIFPLQPKNPDVFRFLAFHSRFWASLGTKHSFSSVDSDTQAPIIVKNMSWLTLKSPKLIKDKDVFKVLEFLDEQTGEKERAQSPRSGRFDPLEIFPEWFENPLQLCNFSIVFEPTVKFLYSQDEFRAWFGSLQHLNREYFRILFLLQLIQVDLWLASRGEDEIVCEAISLSTTTLALLDMSSALSHKPSAFPMSQGTQSSRWRELETRCPEDDIAVGHFETLQLLEDLIAEFKDLEFYERDGFFPNSFKAKGGDHTHMTPTEEQNCRSLEHKFETNAFLLSSLTHFPPHYRSLYAKHYSDQVDTLFRALSNVLETRYTSIESNIVDSKGEDSKRRAPNDKSTGEEIRDALIWRCILMGMLFSTALDNSDLLSSGVWERVVPII